MEVGEGKGSMKIGVNEFDLPFNGTFDEDSEIPVKAVPAAFYRFESWGGDVSGTDNPITVKMTQDVWVEARFAVNWQSIGLITGGVLIAALAVAILITRRHSGDVRNSKSENEA